MAIRRCKETTFKAQWYVLSALKLVSVVACRSWKNDARVMENHGKIMEFDSGKALGTLFYLCELDQRRPITQQEMCQCSLGNRIEMIKKVNRVNWLISADNCVTVI